MKKLLLSLLVLLFCLASAPAADQAHRIGGGVNYWVALDDLDSDFDEEGLSYLATYQYRPTLVGFQADVEFLPDLFGENAIAPAAYLLVGSAIYAAAGAGMLSVDGEWAEEPFFALKAGLDLELLPSIYLDLSASYRFNYGINLDDALDEIDTDTVFLGAGLRLGF